MQIYIQLISRPEAGSELCLHNHYTSPVRGPDSNRPRSRAESSPKQGRGRVLVPAFYAPKFRILGERGHKERKKYDPTSAVHLIGSTPDYINHYFLDTAQNTLGRTPLFV